MRSGLQQPSMAKYVSDRPPLFRQRSGLFTQAKFTEEELKKVAGILEIPSASALGELGNHWWPNRGLGPMPPQDPVIYRLYEVDIFLILN